MRILRNLFALVAGSLLVPGLAALSYAHTTDTSQTTSNANLGEFWATILLAASAVSLAVTATAALAISLGNLRRTK